MYHVGDVVVHPIHGAGFIDGVETQRTVGEAHGQTYYVFRIPTTQLVMHIPVEPQGNSGLRPLMTDQQARALMDSFSEIEVCEHANWSKRYQENLVRLKSGDLNQVCQVIKGLMVREFQRGLSTGDRKLLHTAKQVFISEMSMATGLEYANIEHYISGAIKASMAGRV